MATIYSALIFEGHDLGSPEQVFLDPSFVWVVRSIDIFLPGDTGSISCSVIAAHTGGTFFNVGQAAVPPNGLWAGWNGRQVFVPITDEPTIIVDGSSALGDGPDCRISGYKLYAP